jgi:RNase P protein component
MFENKKNILKKNKITILFKYGSQIKGSSFITIFKLINQLNNNKKYILILKKNFSSNNRNSLKKRFKYILKSKKYKKILKNKLSIIIFNSQSSLELFQLLIKKFFLILKKTNKNIKNYTNLYFFFIKNI